MSAFIRRILAEVRGYRKWRREQSAEDAVTMLARWHEEGEKARDKRLTEEIEQILTEADGNG